MIGENNYGTWKTEKRRSLQSHKDLHIRAAGWLREKSQITSPVDIDLTLGLILLQCLLMEYLQGANILHVPKKQAQSFRFPLPNKIECNKILNLIFVTGNKFNDLF